MPAGRRLVSRRTTLGLGVAGLVVVAGCDDGEDEPAAGSTSGSTTETSTSDDPDGDLVEAVLGALAGAERLALAGGYPQLAALHRAHIEALDGPPPLPARGNPTPSAVRRREQRLRTFLVESAVAARSGALARLLASMSAGVSQHLTTLPAEGR